MRINLGRGILTYPPQTTTAVRATPGSGGPSVADVRTLTRSIWHAAVTHGLHVGIIVVLDLWLTRRYFSTGLPAGTDMLGLVSRARQNASWAAAISPWAPSALGAPREMGLDNALGLFAIVTGSAVVAVKLAVGAVLLASGVSTYLLVWRWFGVRRAGTIAALLYTVSQPSLGHWASGHLNVEILIAATPLLLLLWDMCLRDPGWRVAVLLSLVLSALIFVRPDLILWIFPFLALQFVIHLVSVRNARAMLRRLLLPVALVGTTVIALAVYELVPIILTSAPAWVTTNSLFSVQDILARSVDLYPATIGISREIGYLAFNNDQTWWSHPFLPVWAYWGLSSIQVCLACCVLLWRRDERVVFLLGSSIIASFMAKSIRPPLDEPYRWAIRHLPIFGNLRATDRWEIIACLAYAVLAGVTLDRLIARVRGQSTRLIFATLATLLLLTPISPTLWHGFNTWQPSLGQRAMLSTVRGKAGNFLTASIPFGQTSRFVQTPQYNGWEHDLGAESAAFDGHPSLGEGGWDTSLAGFNAFATNLLRERDPAFERLLATVGVKYLFDFGYPASAPHLVPQDARAGRAISGATSSWQQRAVHDVSGFSRINRTPSGSVYELRNASPLVSFRPNVALILGGRDGLAALADMPGLNLREWAPILMDDVLRNGGLDALLRLIRQANLVLVSDERLTDLAATSSDPLARAGGFTSDAQLIRLSQNIPIDQSTSTGSLEDESVAPATPGASSSSTTVTVKHPEAVRVWVRALRGQTAAKILVSIDGHITGRLSMLAAGSGFTWVDTGPVRLTPGKHTVRTSAVPSKFGDSYEVDEVKVISTAQFSKVKQEIAASLHKARHTTVYAIDRRDSLKWASLSPLRMVPLTGTPSRFWELRNPHAGNIVSNPARTASTLALTLRSARRYYTILEHRFARPLDWERVPYVVLSYRASLSHVPYQLFVDFSKTHLGSVRFNLPYTGGGWHTVVFGTSAMQAEPSRGNWTHIVGLRIASSSKSSRGQIELGALREVEAPRAAQFIYPLVADHVARRVRTIGRARGAVSFISGGVRIMATPASSPGKIFLFPAGYQVRQEPPVPVFYTVVNPTHVKYSFVAKTPGVLVFGKSFNRAWRRVTAGGQEFPVPAFSIESGFFVTGGRNVGSIVYAPGNVEQASDWIAMAGFVLMGVLSVFWPRHRSVTPKPKFAGDAPHATADESSPLSDAWRLPWVAGILFLAIVPIAVWFGAFATANLLTMAYLLLIFLATVALAYEIHRSAT